MNGSMCLVPSLGFVSFCLFCILPIHQILLYHITLYYGIISKTSVCSLMRNRNGVLLDGRGSREELREVEGREP